jgi:hypothetical protein
VLVIATLGTFLPPIISIWLFEMSSPLAILTGGHFVTLVTLIVSAYFGANVTQKHVLKHDDTVSTTTDAEEEEIINIEKNEEGEA